MFDNSCFSLYICARLLEVHKLGFFNYLPGQLGTCFGYGQVFDWFGRVFIGLWPGQTVPVSLKNETWFVPAGRVVQFRVGSGRY